MVAPMNRRLASSSNEKKQLTKESCLVCQRRGGVLVGRVKSRSAALQWRCRDCGAIWIGPERRNADDLTARVFLPVDQRRRRAIPEP